jgi:hypothetical protein
MMLFFLSDVKHEWILAYSTLLLYSSFACHKIFVKRWFLHVCPSPDIVWKIPVPSFQLLAALADIHICLLFMILEKSSVMLGYNSIYGVYQKESAMLWRNVPGVILH